MSLLALQRDMRAWLLTGAEVAAARIGETAAPGLLIYQNNYRSQLVGCLEESFAKTRAWIGEEAFLNACIAHVDRVAPQSWTLDAYAEGFPPTLAALYPADPEVAELAALELALAEVFVGPDAESMTPDRLAAIDWDNAVLHVQPTLRILTVASNAAEIWSALAADETPPPARRRDEPAAILVWRRSFMSTFRVTDPAEVSVLGDLQRGMTFGALCAALAAEHGDEAGIALASTYLSRWIGDGLIAGVTCAAP